MSQIKSITLLKNFNLSTMGTVVLFCLVIAELLEQTQSIQLIIADLVYVTNLKPQRALENAKNARMFNGSFGWLDGWRSCNNQNKTWREYIIRSTKYPKKRLAIRRKYLKLIPQIQIHDTTLLNETQMKELFLDLTSHRYEYTYFPEWHYDSLKSKYRSSNFTNRIIKPVVLERYPTMRIITKIRSKYWTVFEDIRGKDSMQNDLCNIDWLLAFMHFSHKFVVKEILLASKRSLDSSCSNKIFAKLSKVHNEMCGRPLNLLDVRKTEMFGDVKNFFQNGFFDGYRMSVTSCNATVPVLRKILDCSCKDSILREIWKQIKIWKEGYELQIKDKFGTNDLTDLLCIDVIAKYHESVVDNGRILHVICPRDMMVDIMRNKLGIFWNSGIKDGRLRVTPSNLIVEPYSKTMYCVGVMPGWILWFMKSLYLFAFYQAVLVGIIDGDWIDRTICIVVGGVLHYAHIYNTSYIVSFNMFFIGIGFMLSRWRVSNYV